MTDSNPDVSQRNLPIDAVLGRYRQALAQATERAIIAEATASVAEQECAELRLRVIELQEQITGDAEG